MFVNDPKISAPPTQQAVNLKPDRIDCKESKRLSVQTRQGVDYGNWNLIR